MKTLLLMRHAKSSWKDADLDDHDRPLNKRGRQDAPRMGKLLREHNALPNLVLCSTARRARKTAAKVLLAAGSDAIIELRPELYEAAPAACMAVLNGAYHDAPCILLIGHNPCFEELLARLAGRHQPFPTAAIARIEFDLSSWRDLTLDTPGRLVNLWQPRDLD
jgi:phosphohistidine phosphatase